MNFLMCSIFCYNFSEDDHWQSIFYSVIYVNFHFYALRGNYNGNSYLTLLSYSVSGILELGVEDFFGLLQRSRYTSAVFNGCPACYRVSLFSTAFVQILRWVPISEVSMDYRAAIPF